MVQGNIERSVLNQLIGLRCWSYIAGAGSGSRVSLSFGRKIPRKRAITNPSLSVEQQQFEGEFTFFVQDTRWVILKGSEVICTSEDSNETDGRMLSGLLRLVGNSVVSVRMLNERGGVALVFGDGLTMQLDGFEVSGEASFTFFHMGEVILHMSWD